MGVGVLCVVVEYLFDVVIFDFGLLDMLGIDVFGGLCGWLMVLVIVLLVCIDLLDKV